MSPSTSIHIEFDFDSQRAAANSVAAQGSDFEKRLSGFELEDLSEIFVCGAAVIAEKFRWCCFVFHIIIIISLGFCLFLSFYLFFCGAAGCDKLTSRPTASINNKSPRRQDDVQSLWSQIVWLAVCFSRFVVFHIGNSLRWIWLES